MNIAQGLAHAKKVYGNRQAVVCGDARYTWIDFDQRTDALARGLASFGVQRGDRVAVLMLNCHRYLELYYACARMGAVIVPLNKGSQGRIYLQPLKGPWRQMSIS
jgi:acyl-CoA synthetase (AMP-forming)/AMP-acid ligase II